MSDPLCNFYHIGETVNRNSGNEETTRKISESSTNSEPNYNNPLNVKIPKPNLLSKDLRHVPNSRPVVYQSENCKARSVDPDRITGKITENIYENVLKHKKSNIILDKVEISCLTVERRAESDIKEHQLEEDEKNAEKAGLDNEVATIVTGDSNTNDEQSDERSHVNTLIDEMFASVLEGDSPRQSPSSDGVNELDIPNGDNCDQVVVNTNSKDAAPNIDKKVKFNDRQNHEYLIDELQNMKNQQDNVLKRQRLSSSSSDEGERQAFFGSADRIRMNDWYGVSEGKKVRMSSCQIKIDEATNEDEELRMINASRIIGLPPLPKSLAKFKYMDAPSSTNSTTNSGEIQINKLDLEQKANENISSKEKSSLDRKLAILRREMDSLREQDLSLLSKLWFLNESIQDFRQLLQDQDDKVNLILSPSPTPSSVDDKEFNETSTSTC